MFDDLRLDTEACCVECRQEASKQSNKVAIKQSSKHFIDQTKS